MPYVGRAPSAVPVTADDIPANSIDASKIVDGSIELAEIADNSITDAKLNSSKLDGIATSANNYTHPATHATADIADNAITEAKIADAAVVSLKSGRKNLIINGGMNVAQRATSVTGFSTSGYTTCDRWEWNRGTGTYSLTQEEDTLNPSGHSKSFKLACTTSGATNTLQYLRHRLEGISTASLAYGTSGAKATTLSFWVKSNIVDTFGFGLIQHSTTQRGSYHTYTIAAADTWQKVTFNIAGDTAGNTEWVNTMVMSLDFFLSGANGGTSPDGSWGTRDAAVAASADISVSGKYWQITGVQLELGSTATDFEHRSYGEELALCQRYYEQSPSLAGFSGAKELLAISTGALGGFHFLQTKRAAPSISVYSRSGAVGKVSDMATGGTSASVGINTIGTTAFHYAGGSGFVVGHLYEANYTADAEL